MTRARSSRPCARAVWRSQFPRRPRRTRRRYRPLARASSPSAPRARLRAPRSVSAHAGRTERRARRRSAGGLRVSALPSEGHESSLTSRRSAQRQCERRCVTHPQQAAGRGGIGLVGAQVPGHHPGAHAMAAGIRMLNALPSTRTCRSTPGTAPRSPRTPRLNSVSFPSGASSNSSTTSCESVVAGVQLKFVNGAPLSSFSVEKRGCGSSDEAGEVRGGHGRQRRRPERRSRERGRGDRLVALVLGERRQVRHPAARQALRRAAVGAEAIGRVRDLRRRPAVRGLPAPRAGRIGVGVGRDLDLGIAVQ